MHSDKFVESTPSLVARDDVEQDVLACDADVLSDLDSDDDPESRSPKWSDAEKRDLDFAACFGRSQTIRAVSSTNYKGWRQIGITVDSGPADSVADPECFPGYAVTKHEKHVLPVGNW